MLAAPRRLLRLRVLKARPSRRTSGGGHRLPQRCARRPSSGVGGDPLGDMLRRGPMWPAQCRGAVGVAGGAQPQEAPDPQGCRLDRDAKCGGRIEAAPLLRERAPSYPFLAQGVKPAFLRIMPEKSCRPLPSGQWRDGFWQYPVSERRVCRLLGIHRPVIWSRLAPKRNAWR